MAVVAKRQRVESGLRPMDVRRDLGAVATLIELCFGDQLDASGRSAVREKQALSRYGPLLWILGPVMQHSPGWQLGLVWVEGGRVVGNIGVHPTAADRASWLIANVAVHPDYRRRGIARRLVQAALDMAAERGARDALLQVEDENTAARRLYEELQFDTLVVRTLWERRDRSVPDLGAAARFDVRLATRREWSAEYALLRAERPEGLAWARRLHPSQFKPSLWRSLGNFFNGKREERWVVGEPGRLNGWLCIERSFGRHDQLTLVVRPEWRTELERPLLVRALRRLGRRPWIVRLEHPSGQSGELLQAYNFRPLRTLRWMHRDL